MLGGQEWKRITALHQLGVADLLLFTYGKHIAILHLPISTTTGRQHINSSYRHIILHNSQSTLDKYVLLIYYLTVVCTTRLLPLRIKSPPSFGELRSSTLTCNTDSYESKER